MPVFNEQVWGLQGQANVNAAGNQWQMLHQNENRPPSRFNPYGGYQRQRQSPTQIYNRYRPVFTAAAGAAYDYATGGAAYRTYKKYKRAYNTFRAGRHTGKKVRNYWRGPKPLPLKRARYMGPKQWTSNRMGFGTISTRNSEGHGRTHHRGSQASDRRIRRAENNANYGKRWRYTQHVPQRRYVDV